VGNPLHSPVLEISLNGPRLRFSAAATIAISGARLSPRLAGRQLANDVAIEVASGQVLDFGKCVAGCRAYLAIRANWLVARWLGSASRALGPAVDCTPQGQLQKGMVLHFEAVQPARLGSLTDTDRHSMPGARRSRAKDGSGTIREGAHSRNLPNGRNGQPDPTGRSPSVGRGGETPKKTTLLLVDAAPEWREMTRAWQIAFLQHTFTVSKVMDRMGCRLEERMRVPDGIGKMVSAGVMPGTVQLTPAGQLIILLADAQTTGGYYRLVQLDEESLNKVAQLKPGDKLRFDQRRL
ncbi:MAG: biotin-dependent carboxyltransferase, partial [Bacteroidetes bacterium]